MPGAPRSSLTRPDGCTWVKVCGPRTPENAAAVARLGVDAIGINAVPASKRCVDAATAAAISAAIAAESASVLRVGLFVNQTPARIADFVGRASLNAVQLHGEESPGDVRRLAERLPGHIRILLAVREATPEAANDRIAAFREGGDLIAAYLLDAATPAARGGTGQTIDWAAFSRTTLPAAASRSLIVAGGLRPENVGEAVDLTQADGVDVAGGVETDQPGRKSLRKVAAFLAAARRA